jgi:succinyl-CoA--D-citramalate CoA-transferase
MPAPTPKLSDTPGSIRWTGQNPGDANQHVFGSLLGMSRGEIDALRAQNIM